MSDQETLCTFRVDHLFFGIEVSHVQEVLRPQQMTLVPLAPNVVHGLMNLRGQIVTALDMRKQLELPPQEEGRQPMNVLVRMGDGLVSLLVDEIGDVIEVSRDQFEPAPETLPDVIHTAVHGVYKLPGRLLLLLDTKTLTVQEGSANPVAWAG